MVDNNETLFLIFLIVNITFILYNQCHYKRHHTITRKKGMKDFRINNKLVIIREVRIIISNNITEKKTQKILTF